MRGFMKRLIPLVLFLAAALSFAQETPPVHVVFSVHAFPTYVVIDSEGIVRFRGSGAGSQREASLEDAIRKYLKIMAKTGPSE